MLASSHTVLNMTSTKQYRITGTQDGQKWGTKWYDSLSEASDTRWAKLDGVKVESRLLVQEESFAEHLAMKRQGAKIVTCSRHEIAAMARDAMKRGVAFAAQPIAPATYKVMEIA